jgi:hypothetical protein
VKKYPAVKTCGQVLKDNEIEFDHIIPVAKGGSSEEHKRARRVLRLQPLQERRLRALGLFRGIELRRRVPQVTLAHDVIPIKD